MIITTPISLGELVDKISILKIKSKNIIDAEKLTLINNESALLELTLKKSVSDSKINQYLYKLIEINSELWKIEDDIRDCERNKIFDKKFIELAEDAKANCPISGALNCEIILNASLV